MCGLSIRVCGEKHELFEVIVSLVYVFVVDNTVTISGNWQVDVFVASAKEQIPN